MSSGHVALNPKFFLPPIVSIPEDDELEHSNGRVSPTGHRKDFVGKPMTSKQRNNQIKKNINSALKITDKEFNELSPSEKKAYEQWLRDLLKSWQEKSHREIMSLKIKGGKSRRNRSKRGKKTLKKH